ncbi:small nuclear ribonucleoprotein G isoform X1 [Carettochelys insculpta]|uniref:small nuclear ribonucleoprotein G isoform X1 n=1 Tax=Carettochelys insculpta TaxID=44489 RepID=UPI003EBF2820
MSKAHPPELKKFMDKKLSLKLNGGRHVQGILRGFDPFMNLVIDECVEMAQGGQQNNIGMVKKLSKGGALPDQGAEQGFRKKSHILSIYFQKNTLYVWMLHVFIRKRARYSKRSC